MTFEITFSQQSRQGTSKSFYSVQVCATYSALTSHNFLVCLYSQLHQSSALKKMFQTNNLGDEQLNLCMRKQLVREP